MQLSRTKQVIGSALIGAIIAGFIFVLVTAIMWWGGGEFRPERPLNIYMFTVGVGIVIAATLSSALVSLFRIGKLYAIPVALFGGYLALFLVELLRHYMVGGTTLDRQGWTLTYVVAGVFLGVLLLPSVIAAAIFTRRSSPKDEIIYDMPPPPPEF